MEPDPLEQATSKLRDLLQLKVPDLLLQAECGGGLELPTPLPWGFASVPTLYELADFAERDLLDLRAARRRERPRSPSRQKGVGEQELHHQGTEPRRHPGSETGHIDAEVPASDRGSQGEECPNGGDVVAEDRDGVDGDRGHETLGRAADEQGAVSAASPGERGPHNTSEAPCGEGPAIQRHAGGCDGHVAAENPGESDHIHGSGRRDHDRDEDDADQDQELGPAPAAPKPYACSVFLESLDHSRTFRSPHCEVAMVEAMGMMELYDGLSGSTLGPPPKRADLEALRGMFKDHINARWALEAVKQGVAAAKQGNYADAHKAYVCALELDPASVEAFVARGAAHANQGSFADAERDLRHALRLDPGHRNASVYLEAVMRKVEEQQRQLEALEEERQQVLARQHHQARDRRRRQTEEMGGTAEGTGGRVVEGDSPGAAIAASGRRAGQELRYGVHGPPSAPGRLQRGGPSGTAAQGAGIEADAAERRRRRASDSSGSDEGSDSSGSGDSSGGTPGHNAAPQPGSDDIRRALEVVLKARKQKKKSKHKKEKKKHKKSKKRRRN